MTWEDTPRPTVKEIKETIDSFEKKLRDHKHCLYGEKWMKKDIEDKLTIEGIEVLTKAVSDILYYVSH